MTDDFTRAAWAVLGGPAELVERISYREVPGALAARLPVRQPARAAVAVCALAAAELRDARGGAAVAGLLVDEGAVAAAFRSEKLLRIAGRPSDTFAPHSGFWRTADGWVRTHANYPHHRERLLSALGLAPDASAAVLAELLAGRAAEQVQEAVYAAGGLAVAVGSAEPEPGLPLVERSALPGTGRRLAAAEQPAAGARVLDLSRVIAGPVATRTLALLGADVLRIDSPRLPETADAHADTGFGKRSALLDLDRPEELAVLRELAAAADVVVTGYRPGALDRFGLTPEQLPGTVLVQLNAWGWRGPWAGRRGFDSLVQARVGIALREGTAQAPGALPAQALDHGTGYLAAAGVLRALAERQRTGAGAHLRYSLAGTAHWLLTTPMGRAAGADQAAEADPSPYLTETPSAYGVLHHPRPPLPGHDNWAAGPTAWGTDRPEFLSRS
ncbi:carnitine dehydratase [Streptomyces tateyamensis]|uniref:Carnitine dehydratase n=1 Tax=Streptomyces tateyamensis TaxID=565073 RepID=A0A2V4MZG2_9ACTN|nr:CoA transferase [Streptomyces tateyamensis]PYC71018.1 carnitine dehydratase [Streptomyces tateyamensis]